MKINKLHSSIPLTIIEVPAAAIVIYALLYTIVTLTPLNLGVMQLYNKIFITGNSIYAPYMLSLFKHLICLIPGIIISFVISLFRFTSVTVTDTKIIIRQSFKSHSFKLSASDILDHEEGKDFGFIRCKKRYLTVKSENIAKKFRLKIFTAGAVDDIINQVRMSNAKAIHPKIKKIIESYSLHHDAKLVLGKTEIIMHEARNIKINSLIALGICAAIIILDLVLKIRQNMQFMEFFIIAVCACFFIIRIPFEIKRFSKNINMCPEYINFQGEHIMIGDDHFLISDIESAIITAPGSSSSSIYPVQRYLTIKSVNGNFKYWLGSEASISTDNYKKIIGKLNEAFIYYPEKIRTTRSRH